MSRRTDVTDEPLARMDLGPRHAPTLVLLHGITGSALSQADALKHWAALGYRVIGLDARGHGLSPRWTTAQLARAGEVLVQDVTAVLEDLGAQARGRAALGLEAPPAPVLVGHSMGAATAMVAAVRRPELVSGVVLEDPARFGTRSPEELLARGAARERTRAAKLADLPAALRQGLEHPTAPGIEILPGLWAIQRTDPALLRSGVVAPEVLWEEAMAALRVPTLLVTGDLPGSARVGRQGAALVEGLANPRISVSMIPGAGHEVRRTAGAAFYDVVDPWLTALLPPMAR